MTTDLIPPAPSFDAPLTTTEAADLARHEAVIASGLQTFVEVGLALADIRDGRLYRASHHSFSDYLEARWPAIGGRRQADRLIASAEVQENLRPIGLTLSSESQARPLTGLDPDGQRQAMQQATAAANGAPPTAKQVQQAADAVRPKPAPALPTPPPPGDEEIAAAPARPALSLPPALAVVPAAVPPPLLTPLTPIAPAAPDLEQRKLLAAKYELLDQALLLIDAQLRRLGPGPTIVVRADAAIEAARLFVAGPALGGAASMLLFSTTVEAGPAVLPRHDRSDRGAVPTLADLDSPLAPIEQRLADVEPVLAAGLKGDHLANELRACRKALDDLADDTSIPTEAYDALSARIGDAQARLMELESEVTG